MDIREFNDRILISKKVHFLACVKLAAETINAPIPKVNFEGCTSFKDELAHIHLDQNKICISEQYLKRATDEDLRDTATHEVTHLIDETHNISFVKAHINVKTASWVQDHTCNVIEETKRLNSNCVTPAPKIEKIETLESLKSQYRILISEIDDSVGKGHLIKRNELLEKASKVAGEIRAIETPISETNLEPQPHKPDWVDIENENHNLDLSKISLEEKTTQELTEDIKDHELELSQKKEIQMKSEASTPHMSDDMDSKRNSLRQQINKIKCSIKLTKTMSGASISEGGISRKKANNTIQLFEKDITNLEKELRELEPEPKNTAINTTSKNIKKESIDNDFAKILQELHTEAIEESNKNSPENKNSESIKISDKNPVIIPSQELQPEDKAEESNKFLPKIEPKNSERYAKVWTPENKNSESIKIFSKPTVIPKSGSRSRYTLFAIIIFIISIISIAIFVGINSNNTSSTSNQTILVTIPVNATQQTPGSPIAGTWKFENTRGVLSTIFFDKNDNAILDGKSFKYSIDGSNLILKDNKSSSAVPYKLVDGNNLLLKLKGSNYDNYVNTIIYLVVTPTPIVTVELEVKQSSEKAIIADVPKVVQFNEKNINHFIINNVLNKTNKSIINHINSITIIYGDSVECSPDPIRKAIGCAEKIESNSTAISVDIRLVDKGFWQRNSNSRERACGSFEYTLNHEIGHVKGFMNNNESELYADTYANEQFLLKNKTTSGVDGENSQSAFERIESLGQDQCINNI